MGVARNWKHADAADRKLIRVQRSAMKNDLDKALAHAIQLGEARAKAVEERANENIAVTKKGLASQIAVQVENMADNVFRLVQGNRQKIADNYLSLRHTLPPLRTRSLITSPRVRAATSCLLVTSSR